ncbi:MAG TPA: hypothetical protein VGA00_13480 [Acidiferrobacterales bacterium]|jgi:hypothetical protein
MSLKTTIRLIAAAFAFALAAGAQARDDAPPAGCGSWDQVSTSFIEQCALAGATTYIICTANGDVMCCKNKAGGGRDCSTDPGDLAIRVPGGLRPGPTVNQLPPPPMGTRPTAPRATMAPPAAGQAVAPAGPTPGKPGGLAPTTGKAVDGGSKDPASKK